MRGPYARSLLRLAESLVERHRSAPPREYVAAVYRALLGREPDESGLAYDARKIERGIGRANVVDCLLASAGFDAKHRAAPPVSTRSSSGP
jgi:hypothetical protein